MSKPASVRPHTSAVRQPALTAQEQPGSRIVVIGTSGSGKTTMARLLAARLGVPHVELDELHWGPNWTEEPDEVFRERVDKRLVGEGWAADGNYAAARDIVWARADTIVWLDYSLPLILWRLTRRIFSRALLKEEIWHGNQESLRTHFFTKDSLYLWVFQTYRKRRKEFPELFSRPEYTHLKKITLRSAREARLWLARVASSEKRDMEIVEYRKDGFVVSTDPVRIDLAVVHGYLSGSYWARDIPLGMVKKSVDSSLCFGVYAEENGAQVGFARVTSDYATFAYLADLFILEEYRGRGLSKWLMQCILGHPELQLPRNFLLATRDAQGLYSRFGFMPLEAPERYMVRHNPGVFRDGKYVVMTTIEGEYDSQGSGSRD